MSRVVLICAASALFACGQTTGDAAHTAGGGSSGSAGTGATGGAHLGGGGGSIGGNSGGGIAGNGGADSGSCPWSLGGAMGGSGASDGGGPCTSPPYGATVLSPEPAHALAIDDGAVYYAADDFPGSGSIRRVPKAGGASSMYAVDLAYDVAVDDSFVYWVSTDLKRAPLGGGVIDDYATGLSPRTLALDANNVYCGTKGNGVFQIAKSGGAPVELVAPSGANDAAPSLTPDGAYVYVGAVKGILRVPIGGGSSVVVASSRAGLDLIISGGDLYWIASVGDTNVLFRSPVPGGAGEAIECALGLRFAISGSTAYSTNWSQLVKFPLPWAKPEEVAGCQHFPSEIAIDDSNVYFATATGIMVAPKSP